ncbi:tripartite tricarboxylate transporter substrate binding protein [Curvibacter sp. HBC61]|uniref:Tripartite tricarboxylate transporter substrate binding protein n=1 Tax=Curvibacter cyanobacteriorum TaxID=3026422 RepID=A0ABT5MVD7_9BURK|nr:tripartite tricarboxylate transporter substrate binding protein [Curvibacter sp. HBC61]MDD0838019.1 tripartite tricarboxylate transporter substrate binding protein [Curvibacter sp. HBC61]
MRQIPKPLQNRLAARRAWIGLAALALGSAAGLSHAQTDTAWPSKPVKIVVPYGPGGAVDVVTRKLAQKLTEQTGQSFYIENKAGGTGTIGATQVARAEADGYTLMANDTTFSLLPHIFKKLPFDVGQDLVPVSAFVFAPMALAVNATSPYTKLQDLLAAAKREPNRVSYGTGGPGTTPHFATEALGIAAGVNFMHVPFKGAGEATQAVLSNTVDFQIASPAGVMGNVKGGKMRVLAVSGDKRVSALPDAPTFAEAGVRWNGVVNWTGLWAPKNTPAPVLQKLQAEIAKAMASADLKAFADNMGAEARQIGASDMAKMLKDSTEAWGKVVTHTAFEKQ